MNREWFEWTRLNLKRGCSAAEIKSILKKNGFSDKEILLAMSCDNVNQWQAQSKAKIKTQFVSKEEYKTADFDALASPKLLSSPNLKSANIDGVQLFSIDGFLSSGECKALISVINSNLRPSTITSGEDKSGFRTSSTCDLGDQHAKIVGKVDKKIAKTMGFRLPWSETIQGQKYEVGQQFKAHTDYFEPGSSEFETFATELGQRTWTFMIYLNNTPAGGHTRFTDLGLEFAPEAGSAVIWNNLTEHGAPNPLTIHHGMPVTKGNKYIITKWFRAKGSGSAFM